MGFFQNEFSPPGLLYHLCRSMAQVSIHLKSLIDDVHCNNNKIYKKLVVEVFKEDESSAEPFYYLIPFGIYFVSLPVPDLKTSRTVLPLFNSL
jgi:hypothetical protein